MGRSIGVVGVVGGQGKECLAIAGVRSQGGLGMVGDQEVKGV